MQYWLPSGGHRRGWSRPTSRRALSREPRWCWSRSPLRMRASEQTLNISFFYIYIFFFLFSILSKTSFFWQRSDHVLIEDKNIFGKKNIWKKYARLPWMSTVSDPSKAKASKRGVMWTAYLVGRTWVGSKTSFNSFTVSPPSIFAALLLLALHSFLLCGTSFYFL